MSLTGTLLAAALVLAALYLVFAGIREVLASLRCSRKADVQDKVNKAGEIERNREKELETARLQEQSARLEEELIRTNADLLRKEVMLEQINEELLTASRVKSEFISNMGRELKTPLSSIIGLADFVGSGKLGKLEGRQKEYLAEISEGARNLLGIVDNILEYTLIEMGDTVNREEFSMCDAVGEVVASLGHIAASHNVTLTSDVPDAVIWADPKKFRFILYDLLHNAIKFNKPGGKAMLHAYMMDGKDSVPGSPYALFQVEDTGFGFPQSQAAKLFKPFSQLVQASGRKPSGTGMSLALVKKYVDMHGGKVWADSRHGLGSLFSFTLPLAKEVEDRRKKLLVVEDDPDQMRLIMAFFEGEPYDVLKAYDGLEALQVVEDECPDLVLMDVMLPRMGGTEICKALKRQDRFQRFRHIPVIIMTSLTDTASKLKGIQAGADDFIVKPLDRHLLIERVKSLIGVKEDYERMLASYKDAEKDSVMDPLTGLYNRRYMDGALAKELKDSERYNRKVSLLMADIDFFKRYNDSHGHQEGDRLLVKLAGIFRETVREVDVVSRYGGEEFLIILPETPCDMAQFVAERIRHSVETSTGATVSIGVSTYPDDVADKEGLIEKADIALYKAKNSGRNRVQRFSPEDGFPVYADKSF